MNTLAESIRYTEEKKKYQLENLKESHFSRPEEIYNDFLNGKLLTKSTVALNIEYQSNWHLWKYLSNSLYQKKVNYDLLAISTKYAYLSNFMRYLIGIKAPKYNSHVLLRSATMHLVQMLFLGWEKEAIKYGNVLLTMLTDKYYKGGTKRPLYMWFIIKLFCRWQNIELDENKLKMQNNLGIYTTALNNLSSTDTDLINKIINDMAEYHIHNSDEYVKTDEYGNEQGAEFSSANYFIFPVEILMFLLVRRKLGLPEYDYNKNELMSLQINRIPASKIDYPSNDKVDEIFSKLYKENPDYMRL